MTMKKCIAEISSDIVAATLMMSFSYERGFNKEAATAA